MKTKIIIFLVLLFLGIGSYGYYWYSGLITTNNQAQAVLSQNEELKNQAQDYKTLKESVISEKNRCQVFISQEKGDFGDFEYCKDYITWTQNLNLE
ncbi:MAG: hypothetical protein PF572_05940 [Patescibacteria group bacterium]|jgi:hypothetical protein|nr:hypothetical protein [Patescibacteria group bacterium]